MAGAGAGGSGVGCIRVSKLGFKFYSLGFSGGKP